MTITHCRIFGGVPLHGEVRCSGAKNAALPIMAAAILASEPVRLENVPQLTDVQTQSQVLTSLGVRLEQHDGEILLQTTQTHRVRAPERLVRRMRASFCVLGPLLARRGRAVVPLPGGCNIGNRPVDLHLKGLAALGADLRLEHGYVIATAKRLQGAEIDLRGANGSTVTGTANLLNAAVLARGVTILHNAAAEPEIVDLGRFLNRLGAKIEGLGTTTLRIEGVEQLGGATHRLIPDRIEAATLLMAAAISGGSATVAGVSPEHLACVLEKLDAAGLSVETSRDRITIARSGLRERLRAIDVVASPYPGFPTDLQAQWTALMSLADGLCTIRDSVFPSRFLHVAELHRLGATIHLGDGAATVEGVARLSGATVTASDLRASAALVLAGLAAEGRTVVNRSYHLHRGYERLDSKLRCLGARIEENHRRYPARRVGPITLADMPSS